MSCLVQSINLESRRERLPVQEGTSKGSVFIETIVDGEVVQHVDEEVTSELGEPVHIEKNIEYTDDEVDIKTQAQIHTEQKDTEEETGEQHKELTNEEQVEEHEAIVVVGTGEDE